MRSLGDRLKVITITGDFQVVISSKWNVETLSREL